jgi:O-antigen/teichoic acid export membrane protein
VTTPQRTATPGSARRRLKTLRASTGIRAGGALLGGAAGTLAGAYLFNLICIRWLGAGDYGDVAALTAIATIVLLPLLGVQAALAREVAGFTAIGDDAAVRGLFRLTLRRMALIGAPALLALLALAPLLARALNIGATESVVAAVLLTVVGAMLPVLQGFLQGLERFTRIAAGLVVYGFGRAVLVIPLLLAGFGVAGAISAGTIAALVAIVITLAALGDVWRRSSATTVELELGGFKSVIFGLFAFTALMNADVVAAKVFLAEEEAGRYASAVLVGKLAALLPAGVIAPVLLPRATARLQRGEDPTPIVAAALLATLSFGVALTAVLLVVPESLVEWAFGEQFGDARDLLAPSAAVMTLYGLINIHLTHAFAQRDHWLIGLLGFALLVEASLYTVLNDSGYEILAATGTAALFVVAVHEVRSPVATWRLLKRG